MHDESVRDSEQAKLLDIKRYIMDRWVEPIGGESPSETMDRMQKSLSSRYEAYELFFDKYLESIELDFLTHVAHSKDPLGNYVPVMNRLDEIKGAALYVGLRPTNLQVYLAKYLMSLKPVMRLKVPPWDGVDRIRALCESADIENVSKECFYEHVCEWGAGVFARAENNHTQNKILILRGPQGIGKDFFIKTICKGFEHYFGNWTNTRDQREMIMMMHGKLVLNIPEFDSTHNSDMAVLKDIITRYEATYRAPYDREARSIKLRTSFISSSNALYLLRDSTGNRRFVIFDLKSFGLLKQFDTFDGSQIVAQFEYLYKAGFKTSETSLAAMSKYIQEQTPTSIESDITDTWDDEIEAHAAMTQRLGNEFKAGEVQYIIDKLCRDFGIGRKRIYEILRLTKRKYRNVNGAAYRSMKSISIVKDTQN